MEGVDALGHAGDDEYHGQEDHRRQAGEQRCTDGQATEHDDRETPEGSDPRGALHEFRCRCPDGCVVDHGQADRPIRAAMLPR